MNTSRSQRHLEKKLAHGRGRRPSAGSAKKVRPRRADPSKRQSNLPLWLAVDAEGADERIFIWKTLRGYL
jgi:hypothetical protein